METVEEIITGGPKDLSLVVKGKRTKRQRPQSPIPFTIVTHSSSSNNGDFYNNNTISSPATSSDFPAGSTTTEDEDTAKCLILLSKGHSLQLQQQQPPKINNQEFAATTYKFNSKRYIQTPTTAGNGKAGIYVFECKTCSRTFPSFQALGGHRASHKKPKNLAVEEKRKPFTVYSDDDEPPPPPPLRKNNSSSSSSLSLQLANRVSNFGLITNKISSNKLHECSICGAEFNSGQALGGHMRRHRVPGGTTTTATTTTTMLSLIPLMSNPISKTENTGGEDDKIKPRNDGLCLDLDLNLPAPAEDESSKCGPCVLTAKQQEQQKQQSTVVLPATPTLVDCHY